VKTGYDQFFKKAGQARQQDGNLRSRPLRSSTEFQLQQAIENTEDSIRRNIPMKSKRKKKSTFSWKLSGLSLIGFVVALYGFQNYEDIENKLKKVEISFFGMALAEDAAPHKSAEKPSAEGDHKPSAEAKGTAPAPGAEIAKTAANGSEGAAGFDHLEKLNERKKQLDAREEELNRLEAEIQAQKAEVEKRMAEVQSMRNDISTILDDKVKADEQKVEVLVQVYSNMKPQQAAQVFGTMDEDLAIEILGRMKKKNAADIMNLIKPDKAQILSEKFAGYKRKPSSTANGPAKPEGEEKKQ